MTNSKQKLELTWVGKGEEPILEPRILIENQQYSYGDTNTDNMIIHGDNLLALKALEQDFAGKVKCIYIDPPYNTGNAFEHYDDGLEHSIWLGLMSARLKLLHTLLAEDGSIWTSIDDDESHYLKVLCDEIFGRKNFVANVVWQKRISPDARLSLGDAHESILVYAKNKNQLLLNKLPISEKLKSTYKNFDNDHRGAWVSSDYMAQGFRPNQMYEITTPSGKKYYPRNGSCWANIEPVFLKLVADNRIWFGKNGDSIPRRKTFLNESDGSVSWTWWSNIEVGHNQEAKKEVKQFNEDDVFATPKPERLIQRIIHLATNPGDLVLDSFLGSGTTAAVAHKMGRRYIGIELGDHAYTHCAVRMRKVVDGEQGGISKSVNWQGGGGFKFYELAPSLLQQNQYEQWVINKDYDAKMLAQAMAKHLGYKYQPDPEIYWKQGLGSEQDYIYTTTQFVTGELVDRLAMELAPHESLVICAPHFVKGIESNYSNIELRKIPSVLLGSNEFNKSKFATSNYNLNINEVADDIEFEEDLIAEEDISLEQDDDIAQDLFSNDEDGI